MGLKEGKHLDKAAHDAGRGVELMNVPAFTLRAAFGRLPRFCSVDVCGTVSASLRLSRSAWLAADLRLEAEVGRRIVGLAGYFAGHFNDLPMETTHSNGAG